MVIKQIRRVREGSLLFFGKCISDASGNNDLSFSFKLDANTAIGVIDLHQCCHHHQHLKLLFLLATISMSSSKIQQIGTYLCSILFLHMHTYLSPTTATPALYCPPLTMKNANAFYSHVSNKGIIINNKKIIIYYFLFEE